MIADKMVDRSLLDEAMRIGADSAGKANCYMTTVKVLVDGAEQTLQFLDTGRVTQAHDRLRRALVAAHKLLGDC